LKMKLITLQAGEVSKALQIPKDASVMSLSWLRQRIEELFDVDTVLDASNLVLRYMDEDGDKILMDTNDEFEEAIHQKLDILLVNLTFGEAVKFAEPAPKKDPKEEVKDTPKRVEDPKKVLPEEVKEEPDHGKSNKSKALFEFVDHESLPERSSVATGSEIRKEWSIRMLQAWEFKDVMIHIVRGDKDLEITEFDDISGEYEEGELLTVAATFRVPKVSGRYVSFCKLHSEEAGDFGCHLWIDVVAEEAKVVIPNEKPKEEVEEVEEPDFSKYGKYENAMRTLDEMGYKDYNKNLYLLDKNKGSLQAVCTFLFEHPDKE